MKKIHLVWKLIWLVPALVLALSLIAVYYIAVCPSEAKELKDSLF